ncbi:MAG TPA: hypothetical protein VF057_14465 [Thermoanaerobaculia bacterium]
MPRFLVALLLVAPPAAAQLADGDRAWAQRAEGSSGGRAQAGPIDRAIAAYERAAAQNPDSVEARWKLLRSLRFKGAYVAQTSDEKKAIYSKARTAGDDALKLVYRLIEARGLRGPEKQPEQAVANSARNIAGAGEVFVWDAVNWGEWALAYGKMAAARQGAADRIRRNATIAHLINPKLEGGTPSRVLGRLHDQTPRIPFITGWASQKEAVKFLNESMKADPANKITIVFLAEALVSDSASNKARAVKMLQDAIAAPDDPQYRVEQAAATADARALLRKLGG